MKDISVLIVDDNKFNREIMKSMLEDEGCNHIIMAKSAEEAFEYLSINNNNEENNLSVDLILSDLIMPNIDGIELCKEIRLRKKFENIPIIVVTASNDLQNIEKVFEIGVSDYITKPIKKMEFITRIKNALKLKSERERRIQKEKELNELLDSYLLQVAAVNTAPSGIAIINKNKEFSWVNPAFENIISINKKDIIGKKCSEFDIDTEKKEKLLEFFNCIEQLENYSEDIILKKKTQCERVIEVFITQVKNINGEIANYVLILHDITEREQNKIRLYDELKMAKEVQSNVLPRSLEEEKISIKGYYKSADILGGDLYYWRKIDDDKYGVILIDVMGHGIATSLICMYIRSLLPGLIKRVKEPRIVIEELNKHINDFNKSVKSDIDYYFTAIYVLIDNSKKTIEYVNAGHPSGIIMYENGTSLFMDEGCLPIGVVSGLKINTGFIPYNMPFEMLIYSDGFSDMLGSTKNKVLEKINEYRLDYDFKIGDSFLNHMETKIKSFNGDDDISIVNVIGR